MRVALYARVSTDDKGQNPENQLADLRTWAERAGHQVIGEYVDHVSGRKGTNGRPQLAALLADAHKRRFDVAAVWALDRLSREGMHNTIDYLRELNSCGVSLHSYTEPHLSTDNELVRNVLLALMSSLAKSEAERISARVKASIATYRKKHRQGAWGTRPIEVSRPATVAKIKAMLEAGTGIGKTARTLKVGNSVVQRIAKEMRKK